MMNITEGNSLGSTGDSEGPSAMIAPALVSTVISAVEKCDILEKVDGLRRYRRRLGLTTEPLVM